jgi:hypothetical protein
VPDFRDFLAPKQPLVLPYFGGTRVDAVDRRFHVAGELAVGWWQFRIEGRRAVPVEPASPGDLTALPAVRGHWVEGWIAVDGRTVARVALAPDDEPPPLSRVAARRWYSGDLVFESLEFEDDAETEARRALEDKRALGELRGVAPSLRTAFGLALGRALGRELGTPVSVRELVPRAVAIADRGRDAVREFLDELAAERRRMAEARRVDTAVGSARAQVRHGDPVQRADEALDSAKARMLACRRLERGTQLDVTYEVDGTRIITLVDADSLQVLDPGVCLGHGGEYRELTLDAMPSVVREAFETGHLNITRYE